MSGYAPAVVRLGDDEWWFTKAHSYLWTYARTMPHTPHYYIWRGKEMAPEDYDRMFGAIRAFGQPGKFWNQTMVYLIDPHTGRRYWLMERDWHCTGVNMSINGKVYGAQDAPVTRPTPPRWADYDAIAPWWDYLYRDASDADLTHLWKQATENSHRPEPTILDIGAGTGCTLDIHLTPDHKVTVIDPSQGMLNDLVLKHPNVGKVHPTTFEDYLADRKHRRHDIVTASLGSASYLTPHEIVGANKLAKELLVLSFYSTTPPYRHNLPNTHTEALNTAVALPGARVEARGLYTYVTVPHGD